MSLDLVGGEIDVGANSPWGETGSYHLGSLILVQVMPKELTLLIKLMVILTGRNMSIIPIVDKIRSLSILIIYRKSIKVDHTISCDYRLCSIMIDFDRF